MAWMRRVLEQPSAWGTTIRHGLFVQDREADRLAVLLPGDRYRCDAPLLDYARQVCLQHGCDVLAVEYGHQATRVELGREGAGRLAQESTAAVRAALRPHHRRILVVAKSLGTGLLPSLDAAWGDRPAAFVFLTPVAHVVPFMRTRGGLLVVGDHDPVFGPAAREAVRDTPGLEVRVLSGADHQLLVQDDWRASLAALEATCAGLAERLAATAPDGRRGPTSSGGRE